MLLQRTRTLLARVQLYRRLASGVYAVLIRTTYRAYDPLKACVEGVTNPRYAPRGHVPPRRRVVMYALAQGSPARLAQGSPSRPPAPHTPRAHTVHGVYTGGRARLCRRAGWPACVDGREGVPV